MSMLNSISQRAKRSPARMAVFGLVTIAVVAAAVIIAVSTLRDDSQAAAQTASQLEFQVERGTITTSVSIGGTSVFPEKSELTFGSAGVVASVNITAGDTVQAGDVIAEFDAATVASLKVAEAGAESALVDAQAVYDKAESGATSRAAVAKAQEAVALAEIAVTAAREALLNVDAAAGSDSDAVAEARMQLSFAARDQIATLAELDEAIAHEELSDLADVVDDAEADYEAVMKRWLGVAPEGFEEMTLEDILGSWDVTLGEIYSTYATTHAATEAPWIDNPETPWNDSVIWLWVYRSLTDVDTESETNTSSRILTPRVEFEAAWNTLENARSEYTVESDKGTSALLAAEKAVLKAANDVEAAQDALTVLLDPALVRANQAKLNSAVALYDEAVVSLRQEEAATESVMKDAESRLELAEQDLLDAVSATENAVLVSPISGVVLAVNIKAGDSVQRDAVVAGIADTSVVAVEASVDEEDILSLQVGLPASVSLDALAGRVFSGTVTSIGQAEQSQQGAVSFPVVVTLDNTTGLTLVEGLTASAQVINSQVTDVLMVPVAAVSGSIFEPAVERVTARGVESVTVQLGSSNGTFVEIVSGLSENDTVIATIAGQVGLPTTTGNTFIPGGGGFGGGRPAGGFGGAGGGGRGGQ